MKNTLRTSFLSISRNEALARGIAAQFAMLSDPTVEELSDIRTAVSEAVTNAIVHGYGHSQGEVKLDLEAEEGLITVVVEDFGRGIEDVELARRPFYTSAPESERAGLGFAVMEAFMDSVEIISSPGKGTRIIMKKRLSPNA
ncbi:MAG: anti-sigma F factor [Clostridia bacterium]|jgi:stage II sporulation protein AB (anti-sigma F factor)|nr:anti-sigma F factor [Clostridia bacterium]MBR3487576.1 anti-sigma F factor [Clostridia bacterium]